MKTAVLSVMCAQILSCLLTLAASLAIALGAHPESLLTSDWLAPLLALSAISAWLGRGRTWKIGLLVALPNLAFYALIHAFITTRFLPHFWRDGLLQLSLSQIAWWSAAIVVSIASAFAASRCASKQTLALAVAALLTLGLLLQGTLPQDAGAEVQSDGTTIRLRRFSLRHINFEVYDADSDDASPRDDANASWLGQAMPRVWNCVATRDKAEPLCIVNGGFFGAKPPYVALHEAPLKTSDGALYDARVLEDDWPAQNVTLVWKQKHGRLQPQILNDARLQDLQPFEGALGGVRVLIQNGKLAGIGPGMGGATLRCSRTSVAWNERGDFWILSVRDPDGEASSVRADQREKKTGRDNFQNGGWNIAQVQAFWHTRGATNAVLFDGGESAQIAYDEAGRWHWIHSSYHFSRTVGFIKGRPLRLVWPMLPPTLANGGVLNWFCVTKR